MLRFTITLTLTLLLGVAIAFGIALLLGIWFPRAKLPIFLLISAWWLWVGWKYAAAMDRARR